MATIVKSTTGVNEYAEITETELTGADDFVLTSGNLFIKNGSGAGQTIEIHGDGSTGTKKCDGGGLTDLSQPVSVTLADGELWSISIQSVRDFLQGTISVTGGASGVVAYIV